MTTCSKGKRLAGDTVDRFPYGSHLNKRSRGQDGYHRLCLQTFLRFLSELTKGVAYSPY